MTWHIGLSTLISVHYVNWHFLLVLEIGLLVWMTNPLRYIALDFWLRIGQPTCSGHTTYILCRSYLHIQIHLIRAGSNTNNLYFEHVLLQPEVRCFFLFCFRQFCCHDYLSKVTIFHKKYACILWRSTSF